MFQQVTTVLNSVPQLASPALKEVLYRPLIVQCGPDAKCAQKFSPCCVFRHIRTWCVCWPDHCDPSWMVILWTLFSIIFYIADVAADLSVAFEYLDSKDYIWSSLLFGFTFLPMFIAMAFEVGYKRRIWYEVYPVGLFYW